MQTLTKAERLRSRKTISFLFDRGKAISIHPVKMICLQTANRENSILQFGVAVPKKNFKRAVDRNRLKRQMREAMRKNKQAVKKFLEEKDKPYAMLLVFTGKEAVPYREIEDKIIVILQRFISGLANV
jgi:ribonuclease P protein component